MLLALALGVSLYGCGGSNGGSNTAGACPGDFTTCTDTVIVEGSMKGLAAGKSVAIEAGVAETVAANGAFAYSFPVSAYGFSPAVGILQSPDGQVCTGTMGTITSATDASTGQIVYTMPVTVTCATDNASGPELALYAGWASNSGDVDGTGTAARFGDIIAMVADASGNLFVAESGVIRKIAAGAVVTTVTNTNENLGNCIGQYCAAGLSLPNALAVDAAGNLYFADAFYNTIRVRNARTGIVTVLAGTAGTVGSLDAVGSAARFNNPYGIAVDAAGSTVYVADSGNRTIRVIDVATGQTATLAGSAGTVGSTDGSGSQASFQFPMGLALDAAGNIVVADADDNKIRLVSPSGVVTTLAGNGAAGAVNGAALQASFNRPTNLASDAAGALYVADATDYEVRKVSGGLVSTIAGNGKVPAIFNAGPLPSSLQDASAIALSGTTLYLGQQYFVAQVQDVP